MAVLISGSIDLRRYSHVFFSKPLDSVAGLVSRQVVGLAISTFQNRLPEEASSVFIFFLICFLLSDWDVIFYRIYRFKNNMICNVAFSIPVIKKSTWSPQLGLIVWDKILFITDHFRISSLLSVRMSFSLAPRYFSRGELFWENNRLWQSRWMWQHQSDQQSEALLYKVMIWMADFPETMWTHFSVLQLCS